MSATCIIIMAIFVIIISLSIVGLAHDEEMGEPFGVIFSLNKLNKNKIQTNDSRQNETLQADLSHEFFHCIKILTAMLPYPVKIYLLWNMCTFLLSI